MQGPMMTEEDLEAAEALLAEGFRFGPLDSYARRLVAEVRRLRHHLMVLETDGDPAGTATEAMLGRDTIRALGLKLAECRAEERERCAKVADAEGVNSPDDSYANACEAVASSIRALKDQE